MESVNQETAVAVVDQATPVVVKKAAKKASKKAVKKAVKVAKVAKVEKAVKVAKAAKINVKDIVGNNFEIKIMGTCTKFIGKDSHGYLKGLRLEISNPIDSLKDRMDLITKAEAEKYHLGKSKAFIKVTDTADLQTVLDSYFA